MKKYTLLLLVLLLTGNARAQQYEKNILGVRAGLNVSKLTVSVEDMRISTGWRTGFHFAVSDQVLLTRRLPLYLETGVDFSSRGGKIALAQYGEVYQATPRPFYLQVPLLFNYHFNIRNLLTIQPFAGIYGGVGLRGRMEFDNLGKEELFGDPGNALPAGFRGPGGRRIRRETHLSGHQLRHRLHEPVQERIVLQLRIPDPGDRNTQRLPFRDDRLQFLNGNPSDTSGTHLRDASRFFLALLPAVFILQIRCFIENTRYSGAHSKTFSIFGVPFRTGDGENNLIIFN